MIPEGTQEAIPFVSPPSSFFAAASLDGSVTPNENKLKRLPKSQREKRRPLFALLFIGGRGGGSEAVRPLCIRPASSVGLPLGVPCSVSR